MPVLLAAPDKFRGTATAAQVAGAIARAGQAEGWEVDQLPLADGGEGLLEVVGGVARFTPVRGPLGGVVQAEWRLLQTGGRPAAVIEMARAAGLSLAGGRDGNDPVAASSTGVGELIMAAVAAGARRIVVGCGGSATTDGGLGAVEVVGQRARLRGAEVLVACDVRTRFVEAASVFGPQKGARPSQVALLGRRLERLAQRYRDELGVDVSELEGSGAAGGLGGGLAALGARLVPGFDLVADLVGFADHLHAASAVVTGEGFMDATSFDGKVVGGVVGAARRAGVDALVVVGDADEGVAPEHVEVCRLVEAVGVDDAFERTQEAVEAVVRAWLGGRGRPLHA